MASRFYNYWPGNAYKLKFFAYAPQNNNAYQLSGQIAGTPTVTCTIPDNVAEQQDLLVASFGRNQRWNQYGC